MRREAANRCSAEDCWIDPPPHLRNTPDLITGKLPALHLFQLALPAPRAPKGSFDVGAQ